MTPLVIEAPSDHPSEKPGLYLDAKVVFLWDEFRALVSRSKKSPCR
jgi:hypothetical protein